MIRILNRPLPKLALLAIVALGGWFGYEAFSSPTPKPQASAHPTVQVPTNLSVQAGLGKAAYDANCAQCHGVNAAGSDKGPPFIHPIYNPGHHGDAAFFYAVREGVQRHHWNFGDMPAQPQVSDEMVALIVRYVRELQTANGITTQEHRM